MKLSTLLESPKIETLVAQFIKEFNGPKGKKEWGDKLSVVCEEPGNCAMISETLFQWLRENSDLHVTQIVGFDPVNPKWQGIIDEDGEEIHTHTALQVGNKVVDLNARQFDKKLPMPRIITVSQFKKEWKEVQNTHN